MSDVSHRYLAESRRPLPPPRNRRPCECGDPAIPGTSKCRFCTALDEATDGVDEPQEGEA